MSYVMIDFLYILLRGNKPIAFFESAIDATFAKTAIEKARPLNGERLKVVRKDGIPLSGFDF